MVKEKELSQALALVSTGNTSTFGIIELIQLKLVNFTHPSMRPKEVLHVTLDRSEKKGPVRARVESCISTFSQKLIWSYEHAKQFVIGNMPRHIPNPSPLSA